MWLLKPRSTEDPYSCKREEKKNIGIVQTQRICTIGIEPRSRAGSRLWGRQFRLVPHLLFLTPPTIVDSKAIWNCPAFVSRTILFFLALPIFWKDCNWPTNTDACPQGQGWSTRRETGGRVACQVYRGIESSTPSVSRH
jgi:hypothetical protein